MSWFRRKKAQPVDDFPKYPLKERPPTWELQALPDRDFGEPLPDIELIEVVEWVSESHSKEVDVQGSLFELGPVPRPAAAGKIVFQEENGMHRWVAKSANHRVVIESKWVDTLQTATKNLAATQRILSNPELVFPAPEEESEEVPESPAASPVPSDQHAPTSSASADDHGQEQLPIGDAPL